MKRTVSRAERMVTAAGLGLAAAAFLALGVVWHLDRTRRWEPPRWPEPDFVALRSPGANRSAAVGDSATKAVVSGIILLVVVDGIFAVAYYLLNV